MDYSDKSENKMSKSEKDRIESNKMKCPHCGSDKVEVQIVASNKRAGCGKILLYILLGITLVGIPIMILIAVLKGNKTVNNKYYVCQNCGSTINPRYYRQKGSGKGKKIVGIVIASVVGTIILLAIICAFLFKGDYVEFDQYQPLNPQQLHNDYLDDANIAKEKYELNYYFFEGNVYKKTETSNKGYLEFRYNSENDNSKVIKFSSKFFNKEDLKNIEKGDLVTIYCRYIEKESGSEDESILSYSFSSCRFRTEE